MDGIWRAQAEMTVAIQGGHANGRGFMRVNPTAEEDFPPTSVSHFLTPRASQWPIPKSRGWKSTLPIMSPWLHSASPVE